MTMTVNVAAWRILVEKGKVIVTVMMNVKVTFGAEVTIAEGGFPLQKLIAVLGVVGVSFSVLRV